MVRVTSFFPAVEELWLPPPAKTCAAARHSAIAKNTILFFMLHLSLLIFFSNGNAVYDRA
jgi:hypothetical protein